jgi:heme O synthase-like polyprenyltransferase
VARTMLNDPTHPAKGAPTVVKSLTTATLPFHAGLRERVADLVSLTKPRLSSLVLCTTAGGMWIAPGALPVSKWMGTLLGTASLVGAANALNCWMERERDGLMPRTRNRPLPAGRIEPDLALHFGVLLAGFGLQWILRAVDGPFLNSGRSLA